MTNERPRKVVLRTATNPHLDEQHTEADRELLLSVEKDLRSGACSEGIVKINERLQADLPPRDDLRIHLLSRFSALLIDLGAEGKDYDAVAKGYDLLTKNADELKNHLGEPLFYYNSANAMAALYHQQLQQNDGWSLQGIEVLTQAKDHQWRATKALESRGEIFPELTINLANSLDSAGRVSEALYWYKEVLRYDDCHAMAHGNYAQALTRSVYGVTDQYSITLLAKAACSYEMALKEDTDVPLHARQLWERQFKQVKAMLSSYGHSEIDELHEEIVTEQDIAEHSEYRLICLALGLTLSEHGMYCACTGTRRDDLVRPG